MAFSHMPEVERVVGNAEKLRPESWHFEGTDPVHVGDIMGVRETASHLVEGFEGVRGPLFRFNRM